jgi:hypothetical protein
MATAAWRPESRRHLPHSYSENSEEPGNIGYILDSQRLSWQHNRQQSGNMWLLFGGNI